MTAQGFNRLHHMMASEIIRETNRKRAPYSNPTAALALMLEALERAEAHKGGLSAGILENFTVTRLQTRLLELADQAQAGA